jgi:fermentation-respiration switch protein FrsA (DUF1100 family)
MDDFASVAATANASTPLDTPPVTSFFASLFSGLVTLLWRVLVLGTLFVCVVAFNLWRNQEGVLYHPTLPGLPGRRIEDNPAPLDSPLRPEWGEGGDGAHYEESFVRSADGVNVHAWLLWAPHVVDAASAPTVVLCHANAGNMALRLPLADQLRKALLAHVVLWDYRGYGNSEGSPEEDGMKADAEAVLAWARSRVHPDRVFAMGESLGGGVAVHLAARGGVAGAILVNTFTSISDMVDHLMPHVAPLKPLVLRLRWDTLGAMAGVRAPVLLVSGGADVVVPPRMMRALAAAAPPGSELFEVEGGGHNDTPMKAGAEFSRRLGAFVGRVLGGDGAPPPRLLLGAAAAAAVRVEREASVAVARALLRKRDAAGVRRVPIAPRAAEEAPPIALSAAAEAAAAAASPPLPGVPLSSAVADASGEGEGGAAAAPGEVDEGEGEEGNPMLGGGGTRRRARGADL